MIWLALFLIILSLIFGAVASDQLVKPEYLPPEQGWWDRVTRGVMALCAIAAAFAAGLVL